MAKPVWIAKQTDVRLIRELFPVRKRDTHKGDYGKVLLLCGSEGLTGAARLAARAALRTGSGLVYLGVPEKIYPIVAAGAGSEIVFPLPCDGEGRLSAAAFEPVAARMETMDAALLGPAVCGECYEVPAAMQADVERVAPGSAVRTRGGTPGLDLRAGVAGILRRAGIPEVVQDPRCTAEDPLLFSHRRDGVTGRQAGIVWLSQ